MVDSLATIRHQEECYLVNIVSLYIVLRTKYVSLWVKKKNIIPVAASRLLMKSHDEAIDSLKC